MVTQWLGATDRVVAGNETIARNDREHGKNSLDSIKCLREVLAQRSCHMACRRIVNEREMAE